MSKDKAGSLQKARNYAFILLKFRQRSSKEIIQRLKRKHFEDSVIEEAVAFLKEHAFIDDTAFARAWIDSRLKKPLGIRRIKEELRIKGIDNDTINSSIKELQPDYSEEEVVSRIAADKFSRLKSIEPQKAKQRIYSYLLRRGFSPEVISQTISQL